MKGTRSRCSGEHWKGSVEWVSPGSEVVSLPAAQPVKARVSMLGGWPIKLGEARTAGPRARRIVIAADCAAYACRDFHSDYMRGCPTTIGCPRILGNHLEEELTHFAGSKATREITLVYMEESCCGVLEDALLKIAGAMDWPLDLHLVCMGKCGNVLSEETRRV